MSLFDQSPNALDQIDIINYRTLIATVELIFTQNVTVITAYVHFIFTEDELKRCSLRLNLFFIIIVISTVIT